MKKILVLLVILSIIFSFGCGKKNQMEEPPSIQKQEIKTENEAPLADNSGSESPKLEKKGETKAVNADVSEQEIEETLTELTNKLEELDKLLEEVSISDEDLQF